MDWNAATAGYVIAAYAVSALGIAGLVAWVISRDKAAHRALNRQPKKD